MRKFLFLMILSLILGMGTAYALPFVQVELASSENNFTVQNVYSLDWSGAGSGMGEGIGPFGTPLIPGTEFTFRYQAELVAVQDSDGDDINFVGLGSDFEYTIVAEFDERVVNFFDAPGGITGDTAIFSTLPGGKWYMYYDDDPSDTNVGAGTGFDDGIKVASGSISAGQISNFSARSETEGVGGSTLEGLVDFVDNRYIKEMPDEFTIFDFRFDGNQNYPPLDSETGAFFLDGDGGDDDGNFTAYDPVTINDLLLKVDGTSKFTPIPEPSTMLLFGIGLLGLGGCARKKI